MSGLPEKRYLRRGEICSTLGIDSREFTKLVEAGVLTPLYFRGAGRAYFRRDEVVAAEQTGKIFSPIPTLNPTVS